MTVTAASRPDLLIATVAQISASWLSEVLGRDVTAVSRIDRIGTGQMSQSHRVTFTDRAGLPSTVVVKLSAEDAQSRGTGVGMGAYRREVAFYSDLAQRIGGPLAGCHLAEYDEEDGWFTLVLTDVADGVVGDQIAGFTVAEASTALRALARLHAPVMNDPAVGGIDYLTTPSPLTQALLEMLLPGFLQRYADRVAPEHADVLRRFAQVADALADDRRPPLSVVHGDYRLDNLLFTPDGCTVVDWQTVSWGPAFVDVAYLIGGGLPPAIRRGHERELVDLYVEELRTLGVDGLDREACWDEYRRCSFHGLRMVIVAPMVVERTERGDDMFMTWLDRNCQQILDLDALTLLPEPTAPAAPPQPAPGDEGRHTPGSEPTWNESWYFDAVDDSGEVGAYVRLGRLPNQGTSMYLASVVRRGQPSVVFVDPAAPLPPADDDRQIVVTADLRAEQTCVEPLRTFRVSLAGTARSYEDPAAPLRGEPGTPVPFAIDLEWRTDGIPYAWRQSTRYEIPCRVTGTVRVGDESIAVTGAGQRDHSWGPRDWWAQDWMWNSFHLDDGTHTHAVTTPLLPGHAVGYVQRGGELIELQSGHSTEQVTPDGLVTAADIVTSPPELSMTVEPSLFGCLRLVSPDGRVTHFPRAVARVRTDDGRTGHGWIEWNRNQR